MKIERTQCQFISPELHDFFTVARVPAQKVRNRQQKITLRNSASRCGRIYEVQLALLTIDVALGRNSPA
jgi:hypothetical protein